MGRRLSPVHWNNGPISTVLSLASADRAKADGQRVRGVHQYLPLGAYLNPNWLLYLDDCRAELEERRQDFIETPTHTSGRGVATSHIKSNVMQSRAKQFRPSSRAQASPNVERRKF